MPLGAALLIGLAILLLASAALLALGARADRGRRRERRRLVCPRSDHVVDCVVVRDLSTGKVLGVESCSAFLDREDVACPENCAALLNLGVDLDAGEEPGR